MAGEAGWQVLLAAARQLSEAGRLEFGRRELIDEAMELAPERHESSLGPVLQGMTINARGGVPSACGEVFVRVERGVYSLREPCGEAVRSVPRAPASSQVTPVQERVDDLIGHFDAYAILYDKEVPFTRSGQYASHRRAIDRRRALGSVGAAIDDPEFPGLVRAVLRAWGIGVRGSRLVSEQAFEAGLHDWRASLEALDGLAIEELADDSESVAHDVYRLVEGLPIVDNLAKVVAATKTLHHLLPDLVPPIDRAWTGEFFLWQKTADFQYAQERIFIQGFRTLSVVAGETRPSRLVGEGWRTSQSKLLDNALIGWCKHHGHTP